MKIVQVMPEFGLAGAEIMCENLTYELQKHGHTVIVLSMYDYYSPITERMERAGIDVRYLGKKPGLDFSMIRKMRKIFRAEHPDVIHTHRYTPEYAVPAAVLAGVRCKIHTVHNVAEKENGRLARKLNKFFFKHCRLIPVALSELIRDSIVKEYGINKDKIPVIYNGIDLSKCILKNNYGINGKFKILHIGRFSEAKNHKGLLETFGLFNKEHPASELWLIGDGEKRAAAEDYVRANGLSGKVNFLGLQSDVYPYLHDADMFTLPSHYEGIPMTLIEAMGTGLPIVATAVGGIPDMLTNNENALLVDIKPDLICQAFEKFYRDGKMRESFGKKARDRADAFSATRMAKEYCKVYSGGKCT